MTNFIILGRGDYMPEIFFIYLLVRVSMINIYGIGTIEMGGWVQKKAIFAYYISCDGSKIKV